LGSPDFLRFAAHEKGGARSRAGADELVTATQSLVDLMEASKPFESEARPGPAAGRGARGSGQARKRQRGGKSSEYYIQPAKQGQFMVLRKPCGNRATPKVCGTMPSRSHAVALIRQLEKAESAVDDLFLEATDDGIEALEAVLAACCESVLRRGPGGPAGGAPRGGTRGGGRRGRGRRSRGRGGRQDEGGAAPSGSAQQQAGHATQS
jgi:hypothetical protein